MRTLVQRVVVTLVSTICLATAGAMGGYLLGHAVVVRQAEARLDTYANRTLLEAITSSAESRAILATMNASPYTFCSDDEIEYFRQLIFQSQFLKAAGRMHSGSIDCSTTAGRAVLAQPQFIPTIARKDGSKLYKNLAPFRVDDQDVISVQLDQSFVVYNPYNFAS
jgi:sensor c-di-GMP phosphodiesterase-like protein